MSDTELNTVELEYLVSKLNGASLWQRITGVELLRESAHRLMSFSKVIDSLRTKVKKTLDERDDAQSITGRAKMAIKELEQRKSGAKTEKAVAIVLSPYQLSQLTCDGAFPARKLAGCDIIIAKGVYGPVALTQDGVNGFTRQAPELNIRLAGNGRD